MAAELNWPEVCLEQVADEITVGFVGPMATEYCSSGIPFFRSLNIKPLRIETEDLKFISPEFDNRIRKSRLKPGDVVIVRTGDPGTATVIPDSFTDANCADLVIVRPSKQLNSHFLAYYVNAVAHHQVAAEIVGAVQQHFNVGAAKRLKITLPPRQEQDAIAELLRVYDRKLELNRRMNRTLEELSAALFRSWFVEFDPVVAKAAGRQPAHLRPDLAALFPAHWQDSPLGPIPTGWKTATIDDAVSLIIDHRGKTPTKLGGVWSDSGIPAVSAKNIKAGRLVSQNSMGFISRELYEKWMKAPLEAGDTLLTSEAPLGELLYLPEKVEWCLSQRLFALRPNRAECLPTYLYCWLNSVEGQAQLEARSSGTTVMGIRQSELRTIPILLPPLPLQQKAEALLGSWFAQIWHNERESRTLAALRDTLLPKLLSGELRVRKI